MSLKVPSKMPRQPSSQSNTSFYSSGVIIVKTEREKLPALSNWLRDISYRLSASFLIHSKELTQYILAKLIKVITI